MQLLKELIALSESKLDGNAIPEVHVVGLTSKNGRTYDAAALKAAIPLYETADIYLNHSPDSVRKMEDKIGYLEGVYFKEGVGLVAKRMPLNPKHAEFEKIKWWADNQPSRLGLSHNVKGQIDSKGAVSKIVEVRSVDLVSAPATTKTLCESIEAPEADEENQLDSLIESLYSDSVSESNKTEVSIKDRKSAILKLLENFQQALGKPKMELKDLTEEQLRKDRSDLCEKIAKDAVDRAVAREKHIQEAISKVPENLRSALFTEQIQKHADDAEFLKKLVDDRLALAILVESKGKETPPPAKKDDAQEPSFADKFKASLSLTK